MDKNKIHIQLVWGGLLVLAGIGVFFRIPQVMPRIKTIESFSSAIWFIYICFYLLGMCGNFLVERSRMELSTLSGRGFSRAQITGRFARSTIFLALLAGLDRIRLGIMCRAFNFFPINGAFLLPLLFKGLSKSSMLGSFQFDLACLTRIIVFILNTLLSAIQSVWPIRLPAFAIVHT